MAPLLMVESCKIGTLVALMANTGPMSNGTNVNFNRWLRDVMVRMFNLGSRGRAFDYRLGDYQVVTM